jgi:hypothetical protein
MLLLAPAAGPCCCRPAACAAGCGPAAAVTAAVVTAAAVASNLSMCHIHMSSMSIPTSIQKIASPAFPSSSPNPTQPTNPHPLHQLYPPPHPTPLLPTPSRYLFKPCKLTAELMAWWGARLFSWLVGDSEVRATQVEVAPGHVEEQLTTVYIKRCRYLEASECVGMCVNLCKVSAPACWATWRAGVWLRRRQGTSDHLLYRLRRVAAPAFSNQHQTAATRTHAPPHSAAARHLSPQLASLVLTTPAAAAAAAAPRRCPPSSSSPTRATTP